MVAKVLVLICALGQSHDECMIKPVDQFSVGDCGSTNDCYIRAVDAAAPFVDGKTYPMITFGDHTASEPSLNDGKPWDTPRYIPSKKN